MTTSTPTNPVPRYRLIIIRHGETEWSATGRHTGSTDLPLTDIGVLQAKALGTVVDEMDLAGDVSVWSSPRLRAQRTAALAGLTVTRIDPDLAEWDYGVYEGRTSADIRREVPDWSIWTHGAPGGESTAQATERVDRVLAQAEAAMTDGDVVLVGHGHFSAALTARFLGQPIEFGRHVRVLPASASVFHFDHDAVPTVRVFGRTGYDSLDYDGR